MKQEQNELYAQIYQLLSQKEKNLVSERIKRGIARKKEKQGEKENGKV